MQLDLLATELILLISDHLSSQPDINALACTSRRFHDILNPVLYQYNVQNHESSALSWALAEGENKTAEYCLDAGGVYPSKCLGYFYYWGRPRFSYCKPLFLAYRYRRMYLDTLGISKPSICDGPNECYQLGFPSSRLASRSVDKYDAVISLMIDRGIDVNDAANDMTANARGWTVLSLAVYHRDERLVHLLIRKGANVHTRYSDEQTVLHMAAEVEEENIVRALLEQNVDVQASRTDGLTALHFGVTNEAITRLLLEAGADTEAKTNKLCTSLHAAAIFGSAGSLRALIEHGASIDARDDQRSTSLHWASGDGRGEVARILIENGANIDAKNDDGMSPLHFASQSLVPMESKHLPPGGEHAAVARLLIDRGADLAGRDIFGRNALDIASSERGPRNRTEARRIADMIRDKLRRDGIVRLTL
ncbi:hypothetical protein FQN50_005006 [Emmonsiellopsis sp. PD_5]|nr:hypothetical protein FQN50_005006 [Emmonsiellopsis sp. PD_5]